MYYMPLCFVFNTFKIYIYYHDHGFPHCHAVDKKRNKEAKFRIDHIELISSFGWSQKDIKLIEKFIHRKQPELMEKWNEFKK